MNEGEIKVIQMLAHGATGAQIAKEFGVSLGGVRVHLATIRKRFGALNSIHLVTLAIANKVIDVSDIAIDAEIFVTNSKSAPNIIKKIGD